MRHLHTTTAQIIVLATPFFVGAAQAAEWAAEPSVTVREEYNDNYRLTTIDPDKVWQTTLDPRLALYRRSEVWDFMTSGRVRASHFAGEDGLDTVDTFLNAGVSRRFERGSIDLTAEQINDTTLQDEILDIDTGITVEQVDRSQRTFSVSGQHMLTETVWIEGSVGQTNVRYDDGDRFGLLDYDYTTPSVQLVYQWTPKTQIFGTLSHSKVSYDNASALESKTNSLQIGASHDFTETWTLSGSVGSRRTSTSQTVPTAVERPGFEIFYPFIYDIVYVPRDSESTGLVFDATLNREFETGAISLTATRSVMPSATGTDTESTRLGLTGTRRLSAKLSTALAVTYFQSSTVGGVTTRADNDRYRIAPSLGWRLSEELMLNAGYAYTAVEREVSNSDKADSNSLFISLGYTWPRIAVSR